MLYFAGEPNSLIFQLMTEEVSRTMRANVQEHPTSYHYFPSVRENMIVRKNIVSLRGSSESTLSI